MGKWKFTKGLHDIGNGCHAYLQPDGGWCLSNAGLITGDGPSILVDTLTDLPLTREMLDLMKKRVKAAHKIGTLINTHAHPDHTAGNKLVKGAEIIASQAAADEMAQLAVFDPIDKIMKEWKSHGEAGAFLNEVMGAKFDLDGGTKCLPTRTFKDTLTLTLGSRRIELYKVGPAHTRGDTLVFLPEDKILFTGDVLFHKVHPSVMGEYMGQWIEACDRILGWDVEVIVPGHGPIADKGGVREMRDYMVMVRDEAKKRYDAGMSYNEAARDISLDAYKGWVDAERIVITVAGLYKTFGAEPANMGEVMTFARRFRQDYGSGKLHGVNCNCEPRAPG